jgi:hypothetical protein
MSLGGAPFTTLPPGERSLGGIPFTSIPPTGADLGGEEFTGFPPGFGDGSRIDLEPPAPVALELVRPAHIVLSWSGYPRPDVGSYRLYYALNGGAVGAIEDAVQGLGYDFVATTPGTHRFSIAALISGLESQLSPLSSITLTEVDLLPAPSAPIVAIGAPGCIDVAWEAFEAITLNVAGYELWHSFDGGAWELVDVLSAATSWHVFETTALGSHAFRLRVRFSGTDEVSLFSASAETEMTLADLYEPTWIASTIATVGSYQMPVQPTDEQAIVASLAPVGSYQFPVQPTDEQTLSSSITVSGSYAA